MPAMDLLNIPEKLQSFHWLIKDHSVTGGICAKIPPLPPFIFFKLIGEHFAVLVCPRRNEKPRIIRKGRKVSGWVNAMGADPELAVYVCPP